MTSSQTVCTDSSTSTWSLVCHSTCTCFNNKAKQHSIMYELDASFVPLSNVLHSQCFLQDRV